MAATGRDLIVTKVLAFVGAVRVVKGPACRVAERLAALAGMGAWSMVAVGLLSLTVTVRRISTGI